jgi:hypothetical protein
MFATQEFDPIRPPMGREPRGRRKSGSLPWLNPTTIKGVMPEFEPTWRCQCFRKS